MQEFKTTKNGASALHFKSVQEADSGIISIQLYDRQSCCRIVECARSVPSWQSATVQEAADSHGSVVRSEYRSAQSLIPAPNSDLQFDFDEKINRIVKPLIRQAWMADMERHHDTHLVRYTPGGFYVPHVDVVPGKNHRYFTVLCYLNEEFEGGGTSFPLLNFSVRPQTGKALIFPASYLHSAEPVTKGEKYILVSWLTGTPPINWL